MVGDEEVAGSTTSTPWAVSAWNARLRRGLHDVERPVGLSPGRYRVHAGKDRRGELFLRERRSCGGQASPFPSTPSQPSQGARRPSTTVRSDQVPRLAATSSPRAPRRAVSTVQAHRQGSASGRGWLRPAKWSQVWQAGPPRCPRPVPAGTGRVEPIPVSDRELNAPRHMWSGQEGERHGARARRRIPTWRPPHQGALPHPRWPSSTSPPAPVRPKPNHTRT